MPLLLLSRPAHSSRTQLLLLLPQNSLLKQNLQQQQQQRCQQQQLGGQFPLTIAVLVRLCALGQTFLTLLLLPNQ